MHQSSPYQFFLAECDEMARHKRLESERCGYDIGTEEALGDWVLNHREKWIKNLKESLWRCSNHHPQP